jgi:hypothetical protein
MPPSPAIPILEGDAKKSGAAPLAELRRHHRKLVVDLQAVLRFEQQYSTASIPRFPRMVRTSYERRSIAAPGTLGDRAPDHPSRKARAEDVQMNVCYLCKRMIGTPDAQIVVGDPNGPEANYNWEPAHQDCLDRADKLIQTAPASQVGKS